MAVFNSVYEEVRKIGLPYQIKESGGSVLIKISSDIKHQYNQERGKFRFNTVRTFGGSENKNWRSPISYDENSERSFNRINFPDITFFQDTPPPQRPLPSSTTPTLVRPPLPPPNPTLEVRPPSPPPDTSQESPPPPLRPSPNPRRPPPPPPRASTSTSIHQEELSANLTSENSLQLTSTPMNPYRFQKRKIVCQTPANNLNHIPTYLQPSDSELDIPEPKAKEPSERTFHLTKEDKEALVKLTYAYMS